VRGIYVSPADVLDSAPMIVDVVGPPAYAQTVTLSADVTLSGSTGYELVGSPGARIRLNGNGHKIAGTTSGPLTLKFVDVFDLPGLSRRMQQDQPSGLLLEVVSNPLEQVADLQAIVEPAPGEKCVRCWRVLPEVGRHAAHPMLCDRCTDAVESGLVGR